jgi:hypothetical protein
MEDDDINRINPIYKFKRRYLFSARFKQFANQFELEGCKSTK